MIPTGRARLALLVYADGEKRYMVAPAGLKVGDTVISGPQDVRPGNSAPISNIPDGTMVHNVELKEGKARSIARSAGTAAQLRQKKAIMPSFACLPVKSGWCARCAMPPLVRWATWIMATSSFLGKAGRKRQHGHPPDGAWYRHESAGPSPWWW